MNRTHQSPLRRGLTMAFSVLLLTAIVLAAMPLTQVQAAAVTTVTYDETGAAAGKGKIIITFDEPVGAMTVNNEYTTPTLPYSPRAAAAPLCWTIEPLNTMTRAAVLPAAGTAITRS